MKIHIVEACSLKAQMIKIKNKNKLKKDDDNTYREGWFFKIQNA